MAENGNYLTRIDIHLVRDGKELVGLRWNTICKEVVFALNFILMLPPRYSWNYAWKGRRSY